VKRTRPGTALVKSGESSNHNMNLCDTTSQVIKEDNSSGIYGNILAKKKIRP
jgi:hypothetical protein